MALLDLVVHPVLFLLLVVIFVPKVDTPETFSEAPICVFDAEREVTGPVIAQPKINRSCQDQNHDFSVFGQFEFDQGRASKMQSRASRILLVFKENCAHIFCFGVM